MYLALKIGCQRVRRQFAGKAIVKVKCAEHQKITEF
jgi:hypothetical protein